MQGQYGAIGISFFQKEIQEISEQNSNLTLLLHEFLAVHVHYEYYSTNPRPSLTMLRLNYKLSYVSAVVKRITKQHKQFIT
jgi:hypothetical protein